MRNFLLFFTLLFFTIDCFPQAVLSLKERVSAIEDIQKDRLENLLPKLMKREKIDCWIIITREYNEDPIIKSLLPPTWLNARRRTILVFTLIDSSNKVDMAAITRYSFGNLIKSVWNKNKEPDQMNALVDYLKLKNPKKIGINVSKTYGIADGLSVTDHQLLMNYLPDSIKSKIVSSEPLAVSWIETRTQKEMILFSHLTEITHNVIKEAFSTDVITPGVTTTDDVVWWMREKVSSMGLKTWFHPTVDVQRADDSDLYAFDAKQKFDIIQPGDLVHCDFGITYLNLNTDCQQLGYVLKPNEIDAPKYLKEGLKAGNLLEDILTNNFKVGITGNEILRISREKAIDKGLRPQIYTHPLGLFGHSAGTIFGMWDNQGFVPGTGEWKLNVNTAYAIELNTKVYIKEWGKDVRIMLEEPGFFSKDGFRYINKRQKKFHLIGE
tara:strand:- start:1515 stop:2828 length:1314 start_codon:yes stop_codon:yes gene_type:complete